MNKLDMIKAFAELEGLTPIPVQPAGDNNNEVSYYAIEVKNPHKCSFFLNKYDPIEDYALNCKARDEYNVNMTYNRHEESQEVFISIGNGELWVDDKSEVPKAVIECILKTEGLWVDDKG